MAQPGILSSQLPPGEDWVPRALADIRREMRELGPSIIHSFQGVVDELAAHQATLTTTVSGLSAAVADIATNLASINTLITQVVVPGVANGSVNSFTLTSTQVEKVGVDLVVPAGVTQLLLNATGRIYVTNGSAVNSITIGVRLDATWGEVFGMGVAALAQVTLGAGLATLVTGLTPGATLRLGAYASSLGPIPVYGSDVITLDAILLWLR